MTAPPAPYRRAGPLGPLPGAETRPCPSVSGRWAGGRSGPLRAALLWREGGSQGGYQRADGEGSGGVVGPLKTGPLPYLWADGAGPIGGRCAPPPGPEVRAPLAGRTPPTSTSRGSVLPRGRTPALSADDTPATDSGAGHAGPFYCLGRPPHRLPCLTRGAVSPGRMYGPRGPRLDPWGPAAKTTKPHADADSMRSWSTP